MKRVKEFTDFLEKLGIKYTINDKNIDLTLESSIKIDSRINIEDIKKEPNSYLFKILFLQKRIFPIVDTLKKELIKKLEEENGQKKRKASKEPK